MQTNKTKSPRDLMVQAVKRYGQAKRNYIDGFDLMAPGRKSEIKLAIDRIIFELKEGLITADEAAKKIAAL